MKSFIDHKQHLSEEKEDSKPFDEKPDELSWKRWRQLVNMSPKEFKETLDPEAKDTKEKSSSLILLKMMEQGDSYDSAKTNWLPHMWKVSRKNSSSISRVRAMRKRMVGNPFERDGNKTQWLKSLLALGHDPRKSLRKI